METLALKNANVESEGLKFQIPDGAVPHRWINHRGGGGVPVSSKGRSGVKIVKKSVMLFAFLQAFLKQTQLTGPCQSFGTAAHVQFAIQIADVGLHGGGRHIHP